MARRHQPGQRLFTDEELSAMFGVSRLTVRQAVQELVQEGLLYRVRGVGTFVSPPQIRSRFRSIERFFEEWSGQGRAIEVELLAFEEQPCPDPYAEPLRLPPGAPVLFVGRLRRVDGIPTALDRRYLPLQFGRAVTRDDVVSRPLFEAVTERLAVPVVRGNNELQAVAASDEEADLLRIAPGEPILLRRMVLYSEEGIPVVAGTTAYRGDLFIYSFDSTAEGVIRMESALPQGEK